jgi:hypothetical protein
LAIPSQNKKSCKATHKPTHFCSTFYFALPHHCRPTAFCTTDHFFPYICHVKQVLTLMFSFYILALSCMPCSDSDDCKYEQEQQTSNFATTNHSDHEQDTESCSPFCMCACCGQSCSFEHFQADLGLNFPTVAQKVSVYKATFSSEVSFSIWQPPKIS